MQARVSEENAKILTGITSTNVQAEISCHVKSSFNQTFKFEVFNRIQIKLTNFSMNMYVIYLIKTIIKMDFIHVMSHPRTGGMWSVILTTQPPEYQYAQSQISTATDF